MKSLRHLFMFWAFSVALAATQVSAGVVYSTPTGATPLMGYIETDTKSLPGTQYNHPNAAYSADFILDGDVGTFGNTYSGTEVAGTAGSNTAPLDFVGVLWSTPQSDISAIRLTHALFFDGGWFGTETGDTNALNDFPPNGLAANQADANDVAAPTVQITTDGGASWTSISDSNNYVSVIQPVVLAESSSLPPPVTFNFATQNGIDGIRLVGYGGGRSDIPGGRDEEGFIAVREFEIGVGTAMVPEPASMALWGIGTLGMGVIARRRQRMQIAA